MGLIVSVVGSHADWSISTLLLFTAVFILMVNWIRNRRPPSFPPGPWTLPVVGNMHNLAHHRMHLNLMEVGVQRTVESQGGGWMYLLFDAFGHFSRLFTVSWNLWKCVQHTVGPGMDGGFKWTNNIERGTGQPGGQCGRPPQPPADYWFLPWFRWDYNTPNKHLLWIPVSL